MPKRFSTKTLTVVEEPSESRPGIGIFEYTDDYSVFHYGKMPDRIPGKGEAIARMVAFNSELLKEAGVQTHFRRFHPPNHIEVELVRVLDPAVAPIAADERNYLVPLQVIFRNELPAGNSLRRRLAGGAVSLSDLGLDTLPADGVCFDPPLIEFTTKLEEIDRFVTADEARRIAALDQQQLARVRELTQLVDRVITAHAKSVGLEHADGKVEYGIDGNGNVMLVDQAGTPDENRLTLRGFPLGKQVLRDFYLARDLEAQVQRWAANGVPRSSWARPEPLPVGFVAPIADMYRSLCEAWTGERVWGAPPLDEALATVTLLNTGAVAW
ncbi:phosphoribosylaminoimidazolesuccinocarboxamide synthase [Nocardia anaemiae]|uniref:phosphoribosylaminoimidazolesuccinocarboxamide synthase n=1 Tax=Nocardia anaemiae TaxID=263910 RepID=UPI0007A3F748|nr:phosphoribosylaminoimidazolesuccinocarboxamide synthase [Nocardia anaemiae]